ncbi:hypothetical protein [Tannerella forsythia]|uniref:hypothetical protein n=1 Tax=Tannerella forsythia TaxID=28112 RepID=UPI001639E4F9|nr:hypothetical protein [Tannerella forsythia]
MLEELNLQEMSEIKGGVSVEEYCGTLNMLIDSNWSTWNNHQREAATNAWAAHCR